MCASRSCAWHLPAALPGCHAWALWTRTFANSRLRLCRYRSGRIAVAAACRHAPDGRGCALAERCARACGPRATRRRLPSTQSDPSLLRVGPRRAVNACVAIANIVKSSLGPVGLDKARLRCGSARRRAGRLVSTPLCPSASRPWPCLGPWPQRSDSFPALHLLQRCPASRGRSALSPRPSGLCAHASLSRCLWTTWVTSRSPTTGPPS